ncbi:MAG TPA: DNA polymerase I [Caldisericia bacterium]|nr:DNA polymerase I [Caldisericia bacterium]HPF49259.1 DNA polymerase I [Caldisericia bacterium]HPI84061.1 DNA polymerase I [Caldisericia bacterium]HPQ93319.1 DNA polymerase I [Caldisericia bacterium]HRV75299.1 DNA polymerase I [Caldisericia bacterium]
MIKVLLVDGLSLLFRAFYAMPASMTAKDGTPTGALYGFLRLLLGAVDLEKPDKVVVCLDPGGKNFRHDVDDNYKANRTSPPDDLAAQIKLLPQMLSEMGVKALSCEGFEADDVIATIARREGNRGNKVAVMSGDRDLLQIVSDNVSVLINKKGVSNIDEYTPEKLQEVYNMTPSQFVWFKALMGDPSDNYSGVPGVGEKTAKKIVTESNGLDEIKSHSKVSSHLEQFEKSIELATVRSDAPVECDVGSIKSSFVPELAKEAVKKYGFSSLTSRFNGAKRPKNVSVLPVDAVPKEASGRFALHVSDIDVSYADDETHFKVDIGSGLFSKKDTAIDSFASLLQSKNPKILMNLKEVLHKIPVSDPVFDISLAAYLDDAGRNKFDIDSLKNVYLDSDLPPAQAMREIAKKLEEKLKESQQDKLYSEIELPLARVLFSMEKRGIKVDTSSLLEFGWELEKKIKDTQRNIYEIAGIEFNIASPKQLSHILYEKMGMKPIKKGKTAYSTSADILEKLRLYSPIIDLILEYREHTKLLNTYITPLPKCADSKGRIHTTFIQTGTATGRLSSADPNLQNIPIRSKWGSHIRKMFVADKGNVLISADYSQIELRVLAHLSDDPGLKDAFNSGQDVHTYTAKKIFGTDDVTSEQRRRAKVVNFGILYGMSAHRLSDEFGVTHFEAQQFIDEYFNRFPNVRDFMKKVIDDATTSGFTKTILGRRRYVPELKSPNHMVKASAERIAVNAPIQGSAADIIKLAMLEVEEALDGTGASMLLQIHDELLVECPESTVDQVIGIVKDKMEGVYPLSVPLCVDVGFGANWLEAK